MKSHIIKVFSLVTLFTNVVCAPMTWKQALDLFAPGKKNAIVPECSELASCIKKFNTKPELANTFFNLNKCLIVKGSDNTAPVANPIFPGQNIIESASQSIPSLNTQNSAINSFVNSSLSNISQECPYICDDANGFAIFRQPTLAISGKLEGMINQLALAACAMVSNNEQAPIEVARMLRTLDHVFFEGSTKYNKLKSCGIGLNNKPINKFKQKLFKAINPLWGDQAVYPTLQAMIPWKFIMYNLERNYSNNMADILQKTKSSGTTYTAPNIIFMLQDQGDSTFVAGLSSINELVNNQNIYQGIVVKVDPFSFGSVFFNRYEDQTRTIIMKDNIRVSIMELFFCPNLIQLDITGCRRLRIMEMIEVNSSLKLIYSNDRALRFDDPKYDQYRYPNAIQNALRGYFMYPFIRIYR